LQRLKTFSAWRSSKKFAGVRSNTRKGEVTVYLVLTAIALPAGSDRCEDTNRKQEPYYGFEIENLASGPTNGSSQDIVHGQKIAFQFWLHKEEKYLIQL